MAEDKDGHRTILNQNGIDTNVQMVPLNVVKKYKSRGAAPSTDTTATSGASANPPRTPNMATNRAPSSPGAQRPIKTNFVQPPQSPGGPQVGQPGGPTSGQKQEYPPSIAIANMPNRANIQHPIRNQQNEQIQMAVQGNKNIIRKRTADGKTVTPTQKAGFYLEATFRV